MSPKNTSATSAVQPMGATADPPTIEVLYFDGCPSHEQVLPTVRRLAARVGATVAVRRVETMEEADAARFLGSPTVRVNGVDIEPGAGTRTDFGLKCRLYRTPDGLSGEPVENWLSDALAGRVSRSETDAQSPGADAVDRILGSSDRWAANRLAGLELAERRLYNSILRGFADGQLPSVDVLGSLDGSGHAMQTLVARDLVQLGSAGDVTVAYPFSARATRHLVRLQDGRRFWAMCAVDALGIPFLIHQPAEIKAQEPGGDTAITVSVDPEADMPRWNPPGAVVVAASEGSGCSAGCACPHINFFASAEAAQRYLAQPEIEGAILTVPDAAIAGRRLFGDLLDRFEAELTASTPT